MFFAGTITVASGSYSNAATGASGGVPFALPPGARSVYLQPSVLGLGFELAVATGISFQTTAARGALLATGLNGPFKLPVTRYPVVVAVYNAAGGIVTCTVFAAPNS